MSARVDRIAGRAGGFVVVLGLGFFVGALGGAAMAYPSQVDAVRERAALREDLRTRCLDGNDNACTLYLAEAQR